MDIDRLSQDMATTSGQSVLAWRNALSEALQLYREAGVAADDCERLVRACADTNQVTLLAEAFAEHRKEHPGDAALRDTLLGEVDRSPYTLAEWIQAIDVVYAWLQKNNRHADISVILGYLACCSEDAAHKPVLTPLTDHVEDMLQTFGFEG